MYPLDIKRGHSEINDRVFNFLLPRLKGKVLDVGGNGGTLLSEYKGNGVCVDLSEQLVALAKSRGIEAVFADARSLPFKDNSFDTVVLSCVLEQIEDWETALKEAIRVSRRKVIGINPIPNASQWGKVQGYVKSLIRPETVWIKYHARIKLIDNERYYFRIWV